MIIHAFRSHLIRTGATGGSRIPSRNTSLQPFLSKLRSLPPMSGYSATTVASLSSSASPDGNGGSLSSHRAGQAVSLLPTYLADARAVEKYSPTTPDGALQLSVAENQMLEDLLVPSLSEFSSTLPFPADAIYYQPTHGRPSFREAMAKYLNNLLGLDKKNMSLDVDGIVVGAGCNAVLENLCLCLAEPGESVLIPTPYYAAFEFDLVARAGTSKRPS